MKDEYYTVRGYLLKLIKENKAIKELCLDKGYILRVSHKCKKICLDEGITAHKLYTKSGKLKLKAVLAFPSNIIRRALNI